MQTGTYNRNKITQHSSVSITSTGTRKKDYTGE